MNKPATTAIRLTKAFRLDRRAQNIALEIAVIGALILMCSLFLSSGARTNALKLALGATDPLVARGFYRGETDGNGRGFRWTDGDSSLALSVQGPGAHLLRLTIASSRPTR